MSTTLPAPAAGTRVRFRGLAHSEWIKARSARPPVWTAAATVGTAAVFAGIVPLVAFVAPSEGESPTQIIAENYGDRPALQALGMIFVLVQALVALVGVLLVSGERGSGLLNVTLATVPRRTPVLVAKLVLSGAIGLVLGLVTALTALAVVQPSLAALGMGDSLWTGIGLQVVVGGSVSVALLSVIGTALASMFSNTATAAGFVLSLILIVPGLVAIIPVVGPVLSQALPSSAAKLLFQPADVTGWGTVFTGLLILVGWAVLSSVVAGVLWKRRDV
jgi:ABC-2 type transport system permease protein